MILLGSAFIAIVTSNAATTSNTIAVPAIHHTPQTLNLRPSHFSQNFCYIRRAGKMLTMQTLIQLQSGALKGAVSLKLSEDLTVFPQEIFDLADTLEVLDLSRNRLTRLPPDFGRLHKLRIFFCSENQFTTLPAVLGDCPLLDIVGFKANQITTVHPAALNSNLRWLILTDNRIEVLPSTIGACARMQKLMLAGNQLQELPVELAQCRRLALLRISANRLHHLPHWLLTMPALSWLALSGNQFGTRQDAPSLPSIHWASLHVHHVLGEGASGIIYKGHLSQASAHTDVAVKIFKGHVTSDGLPEDEMNACIAAGTHPGMVRILGQVTHHPQGRKGLVMELIAPQYFNLGRPPDFTTCTRDVFPDAISLSLHHILKIAGTVASVALHLHSRGIMHGDLYAHNMLVDGAGHTLLGDFGAATRYDNTNANLAFALQRIEVSAFGCLLDDLISLYNNTGPAAIISQLCALRDACLVPDVHLRPDFSYLKDELSKLSALVSNT